MASIVHYYVFQRVEKEPVMDKKVKELLASMTLEEKISLLAGVLSM